MDRKELKKWLRNEELRAYAAWPVEYRRPPDVTMRPQVYVARRRKRVTGSMEAETVSDEW